MTTVNIVYNLVDIGEGRYIVDAEFQKPNEAPYRDFFVYDPSDGEPTAVAIRSMLENYSGPISTTLPDPNVPDVLSFFE